MTNSYQLVLAALVAERRSRRRDWPGRTTELPLASIPRRAMHAPPAREPRAATAHDTPA
jgi:hypothetical protein